MATLRAYLTRSKSGKLKLYPESVFKETGTPEDEISTIFPDGGEWHTITVKDPWLTGDMIRVRQLQLIRDPETRQLRSDPELYGPALAHVAIVSWTLPYGKDKEAFQMIPHSIGATIVAMLSQELFDDEDPFLTWLSTSKSSESSTESPASS